MKVQDFLKHHGIVKNPFAEEDAQTDPVFKQHCIQSAYHPAWDKIFGDPSEPATSIVFGEKGAGKTAMRLQIQDHLRKYNEQNQDKRLFVINYDDFNPILDRFVSELPTRRRRIEKALADWQLRDHMDAILALGVTQLIDQVIQVGKENSQIDTAALHRLDKDQRRDLLMLGAFYDHPSSQMAKTRWSLLRKKLRTWKLKSWIPFSIGCLVTLLVAVTAILLFRWSNQQDAGESIVNLWKNTPTWAYFAVTCAGWLPWLIRLSSRFFMSQTINHYNRVGGRTGKQIRNALMYFSGSELSGQPCPNKDRTDDRYELFDKLQSILSTIGYKGVFVLVDRVDEPHLINGSPELMKLLIWPMLDNKFLKHQGIGVKMMLPAELKYFVEREDRSFNQRARLDKQNLVPSLAWTGEALFDMANARIQACAEEGKTPKVTTLFAEQISREHLIESFRSLRVPRHLHKFLYHLLVAHCNGHTDENPIWKISKEHFETELAMYQRDLNAQT